MHNKCDFVVWVSFFGFILSAEWGVARENQNNASKKAMQVTWYMYNLKSEVMQVTW